MVFVKTTTVDTHSGVMRAEVPRQQRRGLPIIHSPAYEDSRLNRQNMVREDRQSYIGGID
eukprot:scaffold13137_cov57-Cyclotella_meneghiniana.AAC.4